MKTKYGGVTQATIARAISDAKTYFIQHSNDTVVIEFDAGTYSLAAPTNGDKGIIELSGVKPGPDGRLVFRGAGMDKTTLVFDPAADQIYGRNVYRVSFIGLHMTRKDYSVSQGHVVEVAPGRVDLEIQSGFPTPQDIYNPESDAGRYLRRYTDSKTDPQLMVDDNRQIAWKSASLVSSNRWRIYLVQSNQMANYKPGDLIGIKSKHGGQTYWLSGGSDFVFEDIKWTQASRGVFRGGFNKIRITRCVVERSPAINGQTPCLSTPGGGPQIGHPGDPPPSDILVEDCQITATGDDAVAFFNASGTIRNCRISDSFARGILLDNSPSAELDSNILIRCAVLKTQSLH
ncbi:MAG: right-handed parallel beta-helix repeat-containing protein, partial [Limisphaerales bacterium]